MSLELLEALDQFAPLRNAIHELAPLRDHWAGVPMPLEGEDLIIHPSYEFANALGPRAEPLPDPNGLIHVRNSFYSRRLRVQVVIYERKGRVRKALVPNHPIDKLLRTAGCSVAWGIEQEQRALTLLGTMVRHHIFKMYLLTGTLLETSRRTGITYVFRRLRPTVALRTGADERIRVLCCLCMHPIAYYADSWAGAMCPTDDVIAHLSLMRHDEPMFWRRCNQHAADEPGAGL